MDREYSVYKLQNQSGRVYIGVTCQRPELRWRRGKKYSGELKKDIDKYGWDSFTKEILESGLTYQEAANHEKKWIEEYGITNSLYNATSGGEVRSDRDLDMMALKMKGRKLSPFARANISRARKGIVFSQEHKQHLSESHMGQAGYWTGKTRDRETNAKISSKLSVPIRCVETGEIFLNLSDASTKTGYSKSCISKWCNGVRPKKCKLTFERIKKDG